LIGGRRVFAFLLSPHFRFQFPRIDRRERVQAGLVTPSRQSPQPQRQDVASRALDPILLPTIVVALASTDNRYHAALSDPQRVPRSDSSDVLRLKIYHYRRYQSELVANNTT
jgi:hypothetical protein